jgi:hypothetical protein
MFRSVLAIIMLAISSTLFANVSGMIDGVDSEHYSPRHHLRGWACTYGVPDSLDVHVYTRDAAGNWHFVKAATANLPDAAVAQACGSTGAYRFDIVLDDVLLDNFGKSIHVFGLSPNGGSNDLLSNDGVFVFPNAITVPDVLGHELRIETGASFGGAISSLTWNNKEFVNHYDHGREFQVAGQFNDLDECFNPTEAGSLNDGTGPTSTTQVITYELYPPDELLTGSLPAFYLNYNQTTDHCENTGSSAPNGGSQSPVSTFYTTKSVKVGYLGIPNVIKVDTYMYVPFAVTKEKIESLVGSMDAAAFPEILTPYNDYTDVLPIDDDRVNPHYPSGPQTWVNLVPILASNADLCDANNYALAIYNPHLIAENNQNLDVGHFRWARDTGGGPGYDINSWSATFNFSEPTNGPINRSFTNYLVIGNLRQVVDTLKALHETPGLP